MNSFLQLSPECDLYENLWWWLLKDTGMSLSAKISVREEESILYKANW